MQELRYQNIDGRERRIFACGCGKEIFYKKNGINFDKYLITDTKTVHDCDTVRKYDKQCFDCGANIKIYKVGYSWAKEDPDGKEHICQRKEEEVEPKLTRINRNEWVLIDEWSEECNDWREECDIDNVRQYRLPDGSTRIERNHTW